MKIIEFLKTYFGPAIIIATVVLGPGTILTSSRVGAEYGYSMAWVLLTASTLMFTAAVLSARLGVTLDKTLCQELSKSLGPAAGAFVGIVLFLVIACFQSSNNIAVIASIEPFLVSLKGKLSDQTLKGIEVAILVASNILVIATLYGLKNLYKSLEKIMSWFMIIMVVGFGVNMLFAQPSIMGILKGLIPDLSITGGKFLPYVEEGKVKDAYWAAQGLLATTFSIAGAFYQGYLVKEKGWGRGDLRKGLGDSFVGIAALGLTTLMIMSTSAAVLYGRVDPNSLKTASDVAAQLQPLFGPYASLLFTLGIFAGAFSSFLVNASIGGVLLSDGFGMGNKLAETWPKRFTVLALMFGMSVAIAVRLYGFDTVSLIIFAQAMTALGSPILALSLLYLALAPQYREKVQAPIWMIAITSIGFVIITIQAVRTLVRLWLQINL